MVLAKNEINWSNASCFDKGRTDLFYAVIASISPSQSIFFPKAKYYTAQFML